MAFVLVYLTMQVYLVYIPMLLFYWILGWNAFAHPDVW